MDPVKNMVVLPEIKQKKTKTFIYFEIFTLFCIGLFFSILGIALLTYLRKVEKKKMKYVWLGAFFSMGFVFFTSISFNSYENFLDKNKTTQKTKNKSRMLLQVKDITYGQYMYKQFSGLFGIKQQVQKSKSNKKLLL